MLQRATLWPFVYRYCHYPLPRPILGLSSYCTVQSSSYANIWVVSDLAVASVIIARTHMTV